MEFRFIDTHDPLYENERKLRSKVLREPFGFPPGAEVFPFENDSLHLIAIEDDDVIGCALFHPEGRTGRIYQMAVSEPRRGKGVGKRLVAELEAHLRKEKLKEIYLHARDYAVSFYAQLGYEIEGEPFMEIGIEHRLMKRTL
jgi:predicted GNAT family N-acyltransferase